MWRLSWVTSPIPHPLQDRSLLSVFYILAPTSSQITLSGMSITSACLKCITCNQHIASSSFRLRPFPLSHLIFFCTHSRHTSVIFQGASRIYTDTSLILQKASQPLLSSGLSQLQMPSNLKLPQVCPYYNDSHRGCNITTTWILSTFLIPYSHLKYFKHFQSFLYSSGMRSWMCAMQQCYLTAGNASW